MRVAANANIGQVHQSDVTAPAIYDVGHNLAIARRTRQLSWPGFAVGCSWNVVAEIDDDRDLRELHELRQRHGNPPSVPAALGMAGGTSPSGKTKPLPGS